MYDYSYGYDYGYDYGYEAVESTAGVAAAGGFLLFFWLISLAISIFTIVSTWKMFKKAGKPGWASIVPIYNNIVMLEIAELPVWYIILFFIPFANIYVMFKTYIELAHKFGKSTGFGVGMVFLSPIFLGILAFSKNVKYVGTQNNSQPMNQQSVAPVQPTTPVQPLQQNSTPSFCTNCGNSLVPNAKFCTKCGKQL